MAKGKKKKNRSYYIALEFLGLAGLLFLLCSCLSFDIGDWPSSFVYPHNAPAENLCGSVGGFCAYYLLYYIGPGVLVGLLAGIVMLWIKLRNRKIGQMWFRFIGLILLVVSGSSTFYFFWPDQLLAFPVGSGGIVGVGIANLLEEYFGLLGRFLLLAAMWLVGLVLLADTLVETALRLLGGAVHKTGDLSRPAWSAAKQHSEVIGEIWQKLSAKQKPAAAQLGGMAAKRDLKIEESLGNDSFKGVVINAGRTVSATEGKSDELKLRTITTAKPKKAYVPQSFDDYELPPLDLLENPEHSYATVQKRVVKSKADLLESLLSEFNVEARVVAAETGPVVTMFELELGAGVKVSQINSLSNDMARALGACAVRVVAPLPGKHTIGIEVPNNEKEKVRIKDIMQLAGSKPERMRIPLFLGKDSSGSALVSDLSAMPHVLMAGTTGSGKSVCINTIISSILLTKRPDEVKMILVDPKMVEMTAFNSVPHLMCPIVTETQRAVQILEWATVKMDERYALLAEARVKHIADYNKLSREEINARFQPGSEEEEAKIPKKLPYIVIVIDELADLMMTAAKEIEAYIVRLAQKSRAVGIHIVLATQRPQATVVTGLIKSNMPTRIGFRVAARMDSRIILDQNGAETLLGQGDMLFLKPGTSDLVRAQGTMLDDGEVRRIVKHLKEIAEPQFHPELTQLNKVDSSEMPRDELFDDAVRIVIETHRGSVSLLQRRLSIGYARASRMIEQMAASGILGQYKGSQAREVLITQEEYDRIRSNMEAEAAAGYADMADEHDSSEPTYINQGQQEYLATENDEDQDQQDKNNTN